MENGKKNSAAKMVFRVFGIIFSIILVPALIVGIPAGGIAIGVSSSVSQEGITKMVKEAELSEFLLDTVEKEVVSGITSDEVNAEYLQGVVLDSISKEWIDEVLDEVLDSAYNGTRPAVSMEPVMQKIQGAVDEIAENGFQDLYSAWKDGTSSKYFSDSFVQSFWDDIENELVNEYDEYGAASLDELEEKYDAFYGEGAFSALVDEKVGSFEETWEKEFSAEVEGEFDTMTAEAEQELNDELYEIVQNPELRDVFDMMQKLSKTASVLKWVVYGIVLGAILLLVGCFWFGIAGFVVPAIPILIGGVLCKVICMLEHFILAVADEVIAGDPTMTEYSSMIKDIIGGILTPVFDEVSKLGTMAFITGVVLIGLAILRGVLDKNKAIEE